MNTQPGWGASDTEQPPLGYLAQLRQCTQQNLVRVEANLADSVAAIDEQRAQPDQLPVLKRGREVLRMTRGHYKTPGSLVARRDRRRHIDQQNHALAFAAQTIADLADAVDALLGIRAKTIDAASTLVQVARESAKAGQQLANASAEYAEAEIAATRSPVAVAADRLRALGFAPSTNPSAPDAAVHAALDELEQLRRTVASYLNDSHRIAAERAQEQHELETLRADVKAREHREALYVESLRKWQDGTEYKAAAQSARDLRRNNEKLQGEHDRRVQKHAAAVTRAEHAEHELERTRAALAVAEQIIDSGTCVDPDHLRDAHRHANARCSTVPMPPTGLAHGVVTAGIANPLFGRFGKRSEPAVSAADTRAAMVDQLFTGRVNTGVHVVELTPEAIATGSATFTIPATATRLAVRIGRPDQEIDVIVRKRGVPALPNHTGRDRLDELADAVLDGGSVEIDGVVIREADADAELVKQAKLGSGRTIERTLANLRRARASNRALRAGLASAAQSANIAAREISQAAEAVTNGPSVQQPF